MVKGLNFGSFTTDRNCMFATVRSRTYYSVIRPTVKNVGISALGQCAKKYGGDCGPGETLKTPM